MPDRPDEHHAPDATRAPPRARRGSAARRVGPYRIDGELGRGGMGVVYRAFDERLHRDVALKALPAELAADPEARTRLEREARAIALVSHANVASIHGLEESEGTLYLVLELVEGETLRERLDRGAIALDEALALCGHVAGGLAAVHRKGLVHRDLKPSNVMVTSDGIAKLLDFGLARRLRDASRSGRPGYDEVVGTSGFMSPEQLRGETVDARSDGFAWGCLLYECLAGAPAFSGTTWAERDAATLGAEPDWSLLPSSAPAGVVDLMKSWLSKERSARPSSLEGARSVLDEARLSSSARKHASSAVLPRHSLPAERDAFVGREAELAELHRLVDEGRRLVSVLGLGGTGKTRLAVQLARRVLPSFPGGAWFCDLSEARSVAGIANAVATALDVPLAKDDPVVQLGHAIAGRGKCLVVFDNFEQVARHAGDTLGKWLDRASEATFVVTTREVLGLPGEHSLALAPLSPADASGLFVERAKAARSDFACGETEREQISRLVALLDHLPLAIELAAARVRVMPPRVLLERMSERFKLLSSSGARHTRQVTLRATFDWSWELLSEDEKSALAQLSMFEGGFTLEAAEAVLSLRELWPADAVQALVDKSWVRPTSEGRFDVLVSVQEYAAEKLDAIGGGEDAEIRHGACFAACGSDGAKDALHRHGGAARRRALRLDLDNLVAACRRATARQDGETAVATLEAAWAVLELRGPFAAGHELAATVHGVSLSPVQRAVVQRIRGAALYALGRMDEARACHEAALAILREVGDRHREAQTLTSFGLLHGRQGRMDEARACFEASLEILREVGNRPGEGSVLGNLGLVHAGQGALDEAHACQVAALAIAREVGDRRREGTMLSNLGNLHSDQGRMDEARACLDAAIAIQREVGDRRNEGITLGNLGSLHRVQGRMDEAHECLCAALVIHREIGDRRSEGITVGNLGGLHHGQGRMDEARACHDAALAIAREVGDRRSEGITLANLGLLHFEERRMDEARASFDASLAIHREIGNRSFEGITLGDLGNLHREQGRMDEARACLDAAGALLRGLNDAVELGTVLCHRARLEHREGHSDAARAAHAEAEALAVRASLGPDSQLRRELATVRALLEGAAP